MTVDEPMHKLTKLQFYQSVSDNLCQHLRDFVQGIATTYENVNPNDGTPLSKGVRPDQHQDRFHVRQTPTTSQTPEVQKNYKHTSEKLELVLHVIRV